MSRGLTNHVLVITRHHLKAQDAERLNQLRHIKLTLLFTYSGIDDKRIEPYPSHVAAKSLNLDESPRYGAGTGRCCIGGPLCQG